MVHCVSSSNADAEPNDADWSISEKDKPHSSSASPPSSCRPDSYSCDVKSVSSDIFVESSSSTLTSSNHHHSQLPSQQHVMFTYGDVGLNRASLKRKLAIGNDTFAAVSNPKSLNQLSHHHLQLQNTEDVGSGKYTSDRNLFSLAKGGMCVALNCGI